MHKQHPQTAYRKDAVLIGTFFENCDRRGTQDLIGSCGFPDTSLFGGVDKQGQHCSGKEDTHRVCDRRIVDGRTLSGLLVSFLCHISLFLSIPEPKL